MSRVGLLGVMIAVVLSAPARAEVRYVGGWTGSGLGQLGVILGIAVAPDGSVYVGYLTQGRVIKFSATGAYLDSWGSVGTGLGQLDSPQGIAGAGRA